MTHSLQAIGLASIAALTVGGSASGQIVLAPHLDYSVTATPHQTSVADFDGDGDLDLAITADAPDRVKFLLNDGTGGFAIGTDVNLPSSSSSKGIACADLDGDLDLDLVVALYGLDQLLVLVNQGTGIYALGATYPVSHGVTYVIVGQLDGDEQPDLAASCRDSGSVNVLLNLGAGLFGPAAAFPAGVDTRALCTADLDGDGDFDLAAAAHDSEAIMMLMNDGNGLFTSAASLAMTPLKPEGVIAFDLDGDGDSDIASAGSDSGLNQMTIFVQVVSGSYAGGVNYPTTGTDPSALIAGDFDLDYDMDVAVVNENSSDLTAFANDGSGAFGLATLFATGTDPGHLASGDFDANGALDLVTTNEFGNSVSVLMNLTDSAFTDLGFALAGTNGLPTLVGIGTLEPLSTTTAVIGNGLANASAFLILGVTRIDVPFAGGTFVPALNAILPCTLDGNGEFVFQDTWPSDATVGDAFYFQAWILDPAGVKNFSASNALEAIAP